MLPTHSSPSLPIRGAYAGLLRYLVMVARLCIPWALCFGALGQTSLESIEVKHQPPQALVEKLLPELQSGESAIASGGTILLTADVQRISYLCDLIKALDKPLLYALLETRLGPLNQLLREDAFASDVTVISRGGGGVMVIGGASDSSGGRLVSQSTQIPESRKASLSLSNSLPLMIKTMEGSDKGLNTAVSSAVRIEAQSGIWLAWYAAGENEVLIEIAPRSSQYASDMPLRMNTLLSVAANQWVTVAEDEAARREPGERLVLQLRLSIERVSNNK
jgi:hypothetical protein